MGIDKNSLPLNTRRAMLREKTLHLPNDHHHPQNPRQAAKPEPANRPRPMDGAPEAEKATAGRIHLRIVSVRKCLCDPDNVIPKWTIDCLRYCGAIPNDTPEDITLEIAQRKITKGEAEHTEITITYP